MQFLSSKNFVLVLKISLNYSNYPKCSRNMPKISCFQCLPLINLKMFKMQLTNAEFTKRKIEHQVIYYSNLKTDKEKLINLVYNVASSYPKIKIEITETQFMEKFNVAMLDQYFQQDYKQHLNQLKYIANLYLQQLKQLPINDERQDIIAFLSIDLKYELEKTLEKFMNKCLNDMDQYEYYNSYISLQLKTKDLTEHFGSMSRNDRNYTYFSDRGNSFTDVRDLIKKCPTCGLIWFKVNGCDNTSCGNKPQFWDYFTNKKNFRYIIQRDGFKLKIIKQEMKPVQQNQIKKQKTTGGRGCGAPLVWNTIPRLPNIDQILCELYKVKSIQQVMSQVEADKKLKQTKIKIEQEAKKIVNEGMAKYV